VFIVEQRHIKYPTFTFTFPANLPGRQTPRIKAPTTKVSHLGETRRDGVSLEGSSDFRRASQSSAKKSRPPAGLAANKRRAMWTNCALEQGMFVTLARQTNTRAPVDLLPATSRAASRTPTAWAPLLG